MWLVSVLEVFGDVVVKVTLKLLNYVRLVAWLSLCHRYKWPGSRSITNCSWSVFRFVFVLNISEYAS